MVGRPRLSKYSCGENPVNRGPSAAEYPSGAIATSVWVQFPLASRVWYISFDATGDPVVYRST